MDLYNQFKRVNRVNGESAIERNQNLVKKEFENLLKNSANSYNVCFYKPEDIPVRYYSEEYIIIDDGTTGLKNSNKDDKRVMCSMETRLDVGTFISWRNKEWLITAEELASTSAFKKFTLRPCVVYFSKEIDGIVYDFPAVLENLSLQSKSADNISFDGIVFEVDNSSEQIIIPTNEIYSDIIKVNKRIMLNKEKVFLIKKINTFASQGVSIVTLEQVVENTADNFEKNIADYKPAEDTNSPIIEDKEVKISGDKILKIGSSKEYLIELFINEDLDLEEELDIKVETLDGSDIDTLLSKVEIDKRSVKLTAFQNIKNINKKLKLLVASGLNEDLKAELEITIKGII